jgi:hypothetical protein
VAQEFGEQLELGGAGGTGHGSAGQADFKRVAGLGIADLGEKEGGRTRRLVG